MIEALAQRPICISDIFSPIPRSDTLGANIKNAEEDPQRQYTQVFVGKIIDRQSNLVSLWKQFHLLEDENKNVLEHNIRTSLVAYEIAQVFGLDDQQSWDVALAASFHDLDKIAEISKINAIIQEEISSEDKILKIDAALKKIKKEREACLTDKDVPLHIIHLSGANMARDPFPDETYETIEEAARAFMPKDRMAQAIFISDLIMCGSQIESVPERFRRSRDALLTMPERAEKNALTDAVLRKHYRVQDYPEFQMKIGKYILEEVALKDVSAEQDWHSEGKDLLSSFPTFIQERLDRKAAELCR